MALHRDEEPMDTIVFDRESVLNAPEKENDQLHGVSLSERHLLDLSQMVQVVNEPIHNDIKVRSWNITIAEVESDREARALREGWTESPFNKHKQKWILLLTA